MHHVVIIGGGFGGLYAARALRKEPVRVTLIDRRNFHLFQPLLYQVATGALSPAEIAHPLRAIFKRSERIRVLMGDVVDIDVESRAVIFPDGRIAYDSLIIAAGAANSYFGHSEWERFAPALKTIEDATTIRRRVLLAFEAAERTDSPDVQRSLLTFVVVGGGPTGVELAGALGEIANYTLRNDFRNIDPKQATILLIEGADRLLGAFDPSLAERAQRFLVDLGVTVRTGVRVEAIDDGGLTVRTGTAEERIEARTVIWAAGVRAADLARVVAQRTGAATDRADRIVVGEDLTVPGYPNVFVIGDMACCRTSDGKPLPGVAPVAMQQGTYASRAILARLRGHSVAPFTYFDRGTMATVGRSRAIVQIGRLRFAGVLAWVTWLFVHLLYLVAFESRLLVLVQWASNYLTWNRSARLITECENDEPSASEP